MNQMIKKLEDLFKDINKYYSKYSFKLTIDGLDNWLLNNNSVFDFFNQAFNKREFNVDVTESYISRILKDYDLSIAQIEEYGEKLRIEKEKEEEARKKRNKKILISSSIAIILISISIYGYNLYSERQESIKEQLRLEKLAQEKQRDEKLRSLIKEYIQQTDKRDLKQMLTFWSDQPTRYWYINKKNEPGFISKSQIEESILKAFKLNSFSENEIKNISKTDEGIYEVDVIFKFKSKKTGITKHIQSSTILKFNGKDEIIQEYGKGNQITLYDSSKKVKKRFSNGTYEGNLINNKREGYGTFIFNGGTIYEGEFSGDKVNGKGKMVWENGNFYEGEFIDGKRTGFGKFKWSIGDIYEGDFIDGKITGFGKFIDTNGEIYNGEFLNGLRSGKGTLTSRDGTITEQVWKIMENYEVLINGEQEMHKKKVSERTLINEKPLLNSKTIFIAIPGYEIETIDNNLYNNSFRKVRCKGKIGYVYESIFK